MLPLQPQHYRPPPPPPPPDDNLPHPSNRLPPPNNLAHRFDDPPPSYLKTAFAFVPQANPLAMRDAWLKAKAAHGSGIGGEQTLQEREQYALSLLLDNPGPAPQQQAGPIAGPAPRPPPPPHRVPNPPPPLVKAVKDRVVLDLGSDSEPEVVQPPPKRNGAAKGKGKAKEKKKGKGKDKKMEVLELSDDDSDDEPIVVRKKVAFARLPSPPKQLDDAPKAPEPRPGRPAAAVADDEDDDNRMDNWFHPANEDLLAGPDVARRFRPFFAPVAQPQPQLQPQPRPQEPAFPTAEEQNLPPAPPPTPPISDADAESLAFILAVVSDVDPTHVKAMLRQALYAGKPDAIVEMLLNDPRYPRKKQESADDKSRGRKRSHEEQEEEDEAMDLGGKDWLDVKNRELSGPQYESAALGRLYIDFPDVTQATIVQIYRSNSSFYAPTHVALIEALKKSDDERGWKQMATTRKAKGKGKEVACAELETEAVWLEKKLRVMVVEAKRAAEELARDREEVDAGAFFECQCCFDDEVPLSKLIECPGCSTGFCKACTKQQAEIQIGMRKFEVACMAGCLALFPESELSKCLSTKSLAALHKIRMEKEVDSALAADSLDKCPFCPFACIIDRPFEEEKLLRCMREECGKVSCRNCKRVDHLPKTCKEMEADNKINSVHQIEEAMTAALIRRCPKCTEPYIKSDGCNKISCPSCHTLSCFICGKVVAGYQHFANAGTNATFTEPGASCPLWDDTNKRTHLEVEAARAAATAAAALENPEVTEKDLKGLALPPPPPPPANIAHLPPPQLGGHNHAAYVRMDAAQLAAERARIEAQRQILEVEHERVRARMQAQLAIQRQQDEVRQREAAERIRKAQIREAVAQREMRAERKQADDDRDAKRRRLLGKKK